MQLWRSGWRFIVGTGDSGVHALGEIQALCGCQRRRCHGGSPTRGDVLRCVVGAGHVSPLHWSLSRGPSRASCLLPSFQARMERTLLRFEARFLSLALAPLLFMLLVSLFTSEGKRAAFLTLQAPLCLPQKKIKALTQ